MRTVLTLCLVLLAAASVGAKPNAYTRQVARRFVLDDYCLYDCHGYLRTHSPRYRRIFARALNGDPRALRRVCRDPNFHSGDNESWEPVPGNLLFVAGDQRFAKFLAGITAEERRDALKYIYIAPPFHDAYLRGESDYLAKHYPQTYKFYCAAFPYRSDAPTAGE